MTAQLIRGLIGTFTAAALQWHGGAALAAAEYKIVTANEKGTYFAIGADLAKFVAPDADIQLEVLPTAGSAANIKHLRYDAGVKLAVVSSSPLTAPCSSVALTKPRRERARWHWTRGKNKQCRQEAVQALEGAAATAPWW